VTHFEAVFLSAHGQRRAADVVQWGALANIARCRLPFDKTLAQLSAGDHALDFHLPNRYTWIEFLVRQINPWLRHPVHQHSRLFTRADVERLLSPSVSVVECGRYNTIPPQPRIRAPRMAS
jgi:hypothetical protein